jgi:hypothetical protein
MSSYSDFVGYVPDKLRLQLSGTVTGEGVIPANTLGLPNEFFVSTAQGISTTSGGVSNPGICLNTSNSNFNIETGVTFISFQNIVSANGDLTVSGESGVTTACAFPKFEYSAGSITGVNSRPNQYNFSALKAIEGNVFISGAPTTGSTTLNFSGLRRAKGFLLQYNASGTISGLDSAFKSFIACVPQASITGIADVTLNTYPFTGYAESTGGSLPITENSIYILPSGAPSGITASSTFTGDFLSGLKQGSVNFYSPNNFTEVKLAQNYLNPVPTGAPALFNYIVTSGVTGVTFPPVSGYVYYMVTLNSGAASGAPLDIQVKTTGGSGTFLGFVYQTRSALFGSYKRVNITFSGYSATSGNRVIKTLNPAVPFVISCYNASGVFVSGNDLTRFLSAQVNTGPSAYMITTNGPLTYTATGTVLSYAGAAVGNSGGVYFAASGNSTTGTFNFLNVLNITGSSANLGAYALIATGTNSRATLNLPQATGLYTTICGIANNAQATVVIDAPLLATGDSNANIIIQANNTTSATGILTLAHPLANNQITITSTANSGRVTINTTGGTPITSGSFNRIALSATSGGTVTGVLGATSSVSAGISISATTTGIVSLTATGLTGVASFTGSTVSGGFVTGNFPNLQEVTGGLLFSISGSGGLDISNLRNVGVFIISGSAAAGSISINGRSDLSGLNTVTGIGSTSNNTTPFFIVTGNSTSLTGAIVMTGLKQIGPTANTTGSPSNILNNNMLSRIETTGITLFDLPNLTGWYGSVVVNIPQATGFNLSNLQFIGGNSANGFQNNSISGIVFTIGSGVTGNITMTGLQYIYVRDQYSNPANATPIPFIFRASGATSISMPNIITGFLRHTSGNFTNTGTFSGANITGLSFGSSGITKELTMNFIASGCPLNQASVDDILKTFASLDGTNGTTVYSGLTIRLNGLCSAPSAAGSGYRTTLTGAGRLNTVLVN